MSTACWASSSTPNVVTARKVLVRCSRPHMSPRKPECSETARIAAGCRVCSSSARSPPTNIEASPCTRVIGLPASNQRGPSRKWIRSRCRGPSGPATCRNSAGAEPAAQVGQQVEAGRGAHVAMSADTASDPVRGSRTWLGGHRSGPWPPSSAPLVAAGLAVVPSTTPAEAGPASAPAAQARYLPGRARSPGSAARTRTSGRRRRSAATSSYLSTTPTRPGPPSSSRSPASCTPGAPTAARCSPTPAGRAPARSSTRGSAAPFPDGVGQDLRLVRHGPARRRCVDPGPELRPDVLQLPAPPLPPHDPAILGYWLAKTEAYAAACGASAARDLLPHMRTTDNVADLESLRTAIGQAQVTYYGFSYGTYIGQVWATLHPTSIRAMVLDGVVDPGRVWYQANLDQDHAFGIVYRKFFTWIGRSDRVYHLGRGGRQVGKRVARLRKQLAGKPADGKARRRRARGGADDGRLHQPGVAATSPAPSPPWPTRGTRACCSSSASPRRAPARTTTTPMYLATACTDAPWPTDWNVVGRRQRRRRPGLAVPRLGQRVVQRAVPHLAGARRTPWRSRSTAPPSPAPCCSPTRQYDAATPYSGALAVRALFPTASLIEGKGGTTHASSQSGVSCVDDAIAALLEKGRLPTRKAGAGPDKKCPGLAPPRASPSATLRGFERLASAQLLNQRSASGSVAAEPDRLG